MNLYTKDGSSKQTCSYKIVNGLCHMGYDWAIASCIRALEEISNQFAYTLYVRYEYIRFSNELYIKVR